MFPHQSFLFKKLISLVCKMVLQGLISQQRNKQTMDEKRERWLVGGKMQLAHRSHHDPMNASGNSPRCRSRLVVGKESVGRVGHALVVRLSISDPPVELWHELVKSRWRVFATLLTTSGRSDLEGPVSRGQLNRPCPCIQGRPGPAEGAKTRQGPKAESPRRVVTTTNPTPKQQREPVK